MRRRVPHDPVVALTEDQRRALVSTILDARGRLQYPLRAVPDGPIFLTVIERQRLRADLRRAEAQAERCGVLSLWDDKRAVDRWIITGKLR